MFDSSRKLFSGFAMLAICCCTAAATGSYLGQTPRKLELNELIISDAEGKKCASLASDQRGVALRMFDRRGQLAMSVEVVRDSPRDRPLVTLYGANGQPSAAVGYPAFSLDPDTPDVTWNDEAPVLVFLGDERQVTWYAPSDVVGPWDKARFK